MNQLLCSQLSILVQPTGTSKLSLKYLGLYPALHTAQNTAILLAFPPSTSDIDEDIADCTESTLNAPTAQLEGNLNSVSELKLNDDVKHKRIISFHKFSKFKGYPYGKVIFPEVFS